MDAMFQLAVPDLGSLWNLKKTTAHRKCLEILERVCPGCATLGRTHKGRPFTIANLQ